MGTGMLLFPQMYQQLQQQPVQGVQAQQQAQTMCPYCGSPNSYPYRFCNNCGKPSPQMQQQAPAPQQAAAAGAGPKFKNCPYCGQDISGLPKTPKFCPYCSEQLL